MNQKSKKEVADQALANLQKYIPKNINTDEIVSLFSDVYNFYGEKTLETIWKIPTNLDNSDIKNVFWNGLGLKHLEAITEKIPDLYEQILDNIDMAQAVFSYRAINHERFVSKLVKNVQDEKVQNTINNFKESRANGKIGQSLIRDEFFRNLDKMFKIEMEEKKRLKIIEDENQKKEKEVYSLIPKYLCMEMSKEAFCRQYNIDLTLFNKVLTDIAESSPEKKEEIKRITTAASSKYLQFVHDSVEELLFTPTTMKDFSKKSKAYVIPDLIRYADQKYNGGENLTMKILEGITADDMTFMDYKRLFSNEFNYSKIIENVNNFRQNFVNSLPSSPNKVKLQRRLFSKLDSFKKYEKPVDIDYLKTTAFIRINPKTGKEEKYMPTQETIDDAFLLAKYDNEFFSHIIISNYCKQILFGLAGEKLEKAKKANKAKTTIRTSIEDEDSLIVE